MSADGVIAIVDDDESVRQALRRLINSVGFKVETFASAEEFLSSARAPGPDCLILDVRLPGMSGLELQSRLVAANYQLPIIFISAYDDGQTRLRALAAGAIELLPKPFSAEALFEAINSALTLCQSLRC
ncbi:MAG TPA: response regulator [Pyrinomonadaceae bacterium]|jgi:FixJ family two-component response regulator|nr:response regulator [Pyrinomonadaceae bacterium]